MNQAARRKSTDVSSTALTTDLYANRTAPVKDTDASSITLTANFFANQAAQAKNTAGSYIVTIKKEHIVTILKKHLVTIKEKRADTSGNKPCVFALFIFSGVIRQFVFDNNNALAFYVKVELIRSGYILYFLLR